METTGLVQGSIYLFKQYYWRNTDRDESIIRNVTYQGVLPKRLFNTCDRTVQLSLIYELPSYLDLVGVLTYHRVLPDNLHSVPLVTQQLASARCIMSMPPLNTHHHHYHHHHRILIA
jgi:hypothetical protein